MNYYYDYSDYYQHNSSNNICNYHQRVDSKDALDV